MQAYQISKTEDQFIDLLDRGIRLAEREETMAAIRRAMAIRERARLKILLRQARIAVTVK